MRTFAASSLATTPAEAVLDTATRLRALGFRPGKTTGAALCFVSLPLAHEAAALHGALSDLLAPMPFIAFVGSSAFHDQRLPEKRAGLSVAVVEGVGAELRHTLWQEHGMQMAGPLLADSAFATARFVAAGAANAGPIDLLASYDEAGGDVTGSVAVRPQRHLVPGISTLSLDGPRAIVAVTQAARQLGPVRTVTAATQNVIRELDGRPALEQLLSDLPSGLRQNLARLGGSLFASIAVDDDDTQVLRNVTGIDPNTGAVAVNEQPRVGTEVTFSLRDQQAARGDLEEALGALEAALGSTRARLFLVFSSSGRDAGLFGAPLWDVTRVLSRFGPDVPVVGVSGGAEIATCGGRAHVFTHSAVITALV
jgi:small ligand-binding sensory domain FIST